MAEGPTRRLALRVAYDGSAFFGFQRQPGFRTVQEELELAWTAFAGEAAVVHGAGRTDSGVHARGQVVHLTTTRPASVDTVRRALNAYLPADLAVDAAAEVPLDFHARRAAVAKHYLYLVACARTRPVLERGRVWWVRHDLDLAAMRAGAAHLLGTHDFAAFAAAGRSTTTSVRTVRSIHLRAGRGVLAFHVRGDGFLYKQVRNMVGSLVEVGAGRRDPRWVGAVLASGDRRRAGQTAPAAGLTMWKVHYRPDPFADAAADVS